ncbi:MAG: hypothetical protein ACXV2C_00755, partial [Candidatus Bathyarchaeia archaeon]
MREKFRTNASERGGIMIAKDTVLAQYYTHSNCFDYTFKVTSVKENYYYRLNEALKNNKKIFIPTNSRKQGEKIEEYIHNTFPEMKVKMYSAKTNNKNDLKDVNTNWIVDCDVLIITPTITAGISFTQKHFDLVFPYFVSKSCGAIECCQMIDRVRDVREKTIICYIQVPVSSNDRRPTTAKEIDRCIDNEEKFLAREFGKEVLRNLGARPKRIGDSFFDGDNIDMRVSSKDDLFWLVLENKAIQNRCLNDLPFFILSLIAESGANIEILEKLPVVVVEVDGKEITNQLDSIGKKLDKEAAIALSTAPDLTHDEVEIRKCDPSACLSIEKYYFRNHYQWQGEITPYMAEHYNVKEPKGTYKRLQTIKRMMRYAREERIRAANRSMRLATTNTVVVMPSVVITAGSSVPSIQSPPILPILLPPPPPSSPPPSSIDSDAKVALEALRIEKFEDVNRSFSRPEARIRHIKKGFYDVDKYGPHKIAHSLLWSVGFKSICDNSSHSMEDMWLKFDKCKEDIAKEWDLIRENCLPDDFPSVHTKGKSL